MPEQRPTHQQVRNYLAKRRVSGTPPPSPEQVRRELGWGMIQAQQKGTR